MSLLASWMWLYSLHRAETRHRQVRRGASGTPNTLLWPRPPPGPCWRGHIAHPWDTHAQKSSTVLNLVTRRRFACHILLLSFLKNHSAHLGREGKWGGGGGKPVCQTCWSPPSDPTPHSQCWERLPIARSPIPVLQGVLAQAFCQEHLLLLNPSPPALPLLLPALGKEGQPQGAPQPPQQGACDPPQPPPHRNTNPTAGSPEGTAGCPWLCWQAQPTGRGLTCSPVAILASPDSP